MKKVYIILICSISLGIFISINYFSKKKLTAHPLKDINPQLIQDQKSLGKISSISREFHRKNMCQTRCLDIWEKFNKKIDNGKISEKEFNDYVDTIDGIIGVQVDDSIKEVVKDFIKRVYDRKASKSRSITYWKLNSFCKSNYSYVGELYNLVIKPDINVLRRIYMSEVWKFITNDPSNQGDKTTISLQEMNDIIGKYVEEAFQKEANYVNDPAAIDRRKSEVIFWLQLVYSSAYSDINTEMDWIGFKTACETVGGQFEKITRLYTFLLDPTKPNYDVIISG